MTASQPDRLVRPDGAGLAPRAAHPARAIEQESTAAAAGPIVEDLRARALRLPADSLVLLVGPAGCGKSTFARRYFTDTQVVSSDECRRLVSDDEADQAASGEAFAVFYSIVRGRLALGRLTVADATNLRADSRKRLIRIAAERGRKTAAIVFDFPLELCLRRNAARARVVSAEVIGRHHADLQRAKAAVLAEGYARIYFVQA